MNTFPQDKEKRLLELLEQELELFDRIREQTIAQAEMLEAEDTDGFDRALDVRQGTIEKINGLHQEQNVLMQSYVSFSNAPDGTKIDAIELAIGKIGALVEECVRLNDLNIAEAKEKTEEYIKQIGKLSLRRKSLGKYALGVPNDPELFDRKT